MRHSFLLLCLIPMLGGALISCNPQMGGGRSAADSLYSVNSGRYDLKKPAQKYYLPYILEEVSALCYYENDMLACVQDENGKLFFYDMVKEEIVHTLLFEYSGDYEGVETLDQMAYIVKSNGDLFEVPIDFDVEKEQATRFKTPLKSRNNIEGLGYDPELGKLLLVTKGRASYKEEDDKDSRAVYTFDLDKMELDEDPLFVITDEERRNFYKEQLPKNSYDDKRLLFKPSAIAVHPIDNNYYIVASVGKVLLVTTPAGKILESYAIPPGELTQPEGLCFAPDGTMYISSEGEGDRGYVLKYPMLK